MKRIMIAVAATAMSTTAAFAAMDLAQIDTDGDNFASQAEIMAAYPGFDPADFNSIDKNSDNRLSSEELLDPNAQTVLDRSGSKMSTMVMADANGDGFVTYDELVAVVPGFMESDFDTLDSNDDNRISAAEMDAPGAAAIFDRETAANTTMDIASLDTDGDNFLTFDELAAGFSGIKQEIFNDIDTNDDSRISANELNAPEARTMLNQY